MPMFDYECQSCGAVFEKLCSNPTKSELKAAKCGKCGKSARRTYRFHTFSSPSVSNNSELMADEEPYRDMHYYEKKGQWEKAAKAAEGVSEFARNKFIQKANDPQKNS